MYYLRAIYYEKFPLYQIIGVVDLVHRCEKKEGEEVHKQIVKNLSLISKLQTSKL